MDKTEYLKTKVAHVYGCYANEWRPDDGKTPRQRLHLIMDELAMLAEVHGFNMETVDSMNAVCPELSKKMAKAWNDMDEDFLKTFKEPDPFCFADQWLDFECMHFGNLQKLYYEIIEACR